ncbi:hypothetical protein QO006_002984 [Deinococcus enclensis]|uniref:Uncharacterized protein n=1 Tax=Deinococcus enclensis TaxID=1049582 RepID=A0ABT9MG24_9DEIO|nr:hypothetical protein [Deinococcus enclensis]
MSTIRCLRFTSTNDGYTPTVYCSLIAPPLSSRLPG